VHQASIVQHRQIETAAVPRHNLRRELLHAIKEALDDLGLGGFRRRQRPDLETFVTAQGAGNGDDALQVVRQEITAVLCPLTLKRIFGHLGITKAGRQVVQAADAGHIGDGFDIKNEDRGHGS